MTTQNWNMRIALLCAVFTLANALSPRALGQAGAAAPAVPPPVTFTAEQDQQDMMNQQGIHTLRPGPGGNENAPNHANYDEAKANPFPNIPDAFTLNDGQEVTTPAL